MKIQSQLLELQDRKGTACPTVNRLLSEGTPKLTKAVLRAICGLKFMFIDFFYRMGLVGVGPRSALFFHLLRCGHANEPGS